MFLIAHVLFVSVVLCVNYNRLDNVTVTGSRTLNITTVLLLWAGPCFFPISDWSEWRGVSKHSILIGHPALSRDLLLATVSVTQRIHAQC